MSTPTRKGHHPGITPFLCALLLATALWIAYWVIAIRMMPFPADERIDRMGTWVVRGYFGEMFGAINALFSAFAFAGVIYTILLHRRELQHSSDALSRQMQIHGWTNLQSIVQVERSLSEIPLAFRFHGISPDELTAHGVTADELAYLVASFTAGHIYHMTNTPDETGPFSKESYRYRMLASEATEKAWPLLRRMLNDSEYVKRLEATRVAIRKKGPAEGQPEAGAGAAG